MKLNLNMKLLPALVAASLAGCGGGGGGESRGQTVNTQSRAASASASCVDSNQNWQCDDGDAAVASSVGASLYTLTEVRDANNLRTSLRVSEQGKTDVTALSTLRARLATQGKLKAQIDATVNALNTLHGAELESKLSAGFNATQASHPVATEALDAYSRAVFTQVTANATVAAASVTMGTISNDASWASSAGDERRQLSVQSSVVLNNSESNRLYLFDAAQTSVSSREIDLIPPVAPALAGYPKLLRQGMAWLGRAVSVMVDTASAATALTGTPTTGSPVVLQPGKGIAGIQLVNGGSEAFVLLNMLSGLYAQTDCVGTSDGNEGVFKISLSDTAGSRQLSQSPACVHSGFSLIAADASGQQWAAWDAMAQRVWLGHGQTMAHRASLDIKFDADKPPQALAMSPGGRYLAAAGAGRLALINVDTGRVVAQLTGDWASVSQVAFAGGGRRVLVASERQVHAVDLDDGMQLIGKSVHAVAASGETLRGLAVTADGDSYVATSDSRAYWLAASTGLSLGSKALPTGLSVQQATLAGTRLVLLAKGAQDQQFKLMRLPLSITTP